MSLEFGICMEGFEDKFSALVQKLWPGDGAYLEIGLAHGKTFKAMSQLLRYRCGKEWIAYGIDPTPLFDLLELDSDRQKIIVGKSQDCGEAMRAIAPLSLALIDGCHCYDCCGDDFRLVADYVMPGGFVLFHDYAPVQQGGGAQAYHDNRPIEVRRAVDYLKSLKEFTDEWKEHPEWIGDRNRGNVANMGVFEKIA